MEPSSPPTSSDTGAGRGSTVVALLAVAALAAAGATAGVGSPPGAVLGPAAVDGGPSANAGASPKAPSADAPDAPDAPDMSDGPSWRLRVTAPAGAPGYRLTVDWTAGEADLVPLDDAEAGPLLAAAARAGATSPAGAALPPDAADGRLGGLGPAGDDTAQCMMIEPFGLGWTRTDAVPAPVPLDDQCEPVQLHDRPIRRTNMVCVGTAVGLNTFEECVLSGFLEDPDPNAFGRMFIECEMGGVYLDLGTDQTEGDVPFGCELRTVGRVPSLWTLWRSRVENDQTVGLTWAVHDLVEEQG